jgi:hypothetical protein
MGNSQQQTPNKYCSEHLRAERLPAPVSGPYYTQFKNKDCILTIKELLLSTGPKCIGGSSPFQLMIETSSF